MNRWYLLAAVIIAVVAINTIFWTVFYKTEPNFEGSLIVQEDWQEFSLYGVSFLVPRGLEKTGQNFTRYWSGEEQEIVIYFDLLKAKEEENPSLTVRQVLKISKEKKAVEKDNYYIFEKIDFLNEKYDFIFGQSDQKIFVLGLNLDELDPKQVNIIKQSLKINVEQ